MYRLAQFGDMLADVPRRCAYRDALHRAIRPGDAVLDLGCGPGIFAMMACQAGARRVYAIDSGKIIQTAKQLAAANGFADRIEFFHGDSRKIKLPERVDVLVSDVRGVLPYFDDALYSLQDARQRFLKEGGVQIPQTDRIFAAILETDYYQRVISPWQSSEHGLNFSVPLPRTLNTSYKVHAQPEQVLTDRQAWSAVHCADEPPSHVSGKLRFRTERAGTAHGMIVWFETNLYQDVGFGCGPGNMETIYGQAFFPWFEPVPLEVGQEIEVDLRADHVIGDYIWRWDTRIASRNGRPDRLFRQSTLEGAQFMEDALRRHSVDYVPALTEAGQAERWILEQMDGVKTLQEIADAAAKKFPSVFLKPEDAFHRAAQLAEQFSR